jgi:hypothetical protein
MFHAVRNALASNSGWAFNRFLTGVSSVCRDLIHVSLGQGSARALRDDRRARSGFGKHSTDSRCGKDVFLVSEALDSSRQIDCSFDRRVALGYVPLNSKQASENRHNCGSRDTRHLKLH